MIETAITHWYYKGYRIDEVEGGYSIDAIVYDAGYYFYHTIATVVTLDEATSKIDKMA